MSLLCAVLTIPALNLAVDPTEVFGTGLLPNRFQVNDRYLKFEQLLTRCGDCRGFLLGSSRMGYTDPAGFKHLISSGRVYNMNISSANAWDYLEFGRFLGRQRIRAELLVVQLDLTEEFGDRQRYQHHPVYSGESRFRFVFENLMSVQYRSLIGKIWYNLTSRESAGFDWQNGMRSRKDAEQRLEADPAGYVRDEEDFHVPASRRMMDAARLSQANLATIAALRELKALCDEAGTRLIFFVTPHNQHYLDRLGMEEVAQLVRGLATIGPFWNFASYSSVTLDDLNFYETSHYRPHVGRWVTARVASRDDATVPTDFGRWVTADNVEAEIGWMRSNFATRGRPRGHQ